MRGGGSEFVDPGCGGQLEKQYEKRRDGWTYRMFVW